MKKNIIMVVITSVIMLTAKASDLEVVTVGKTSITPNSGTISELWLKDGKNRYGPIQLWEAAPSTRIQLNNSLSELNELCTVVLSKERAQGFNPDELSIARMAISLYDKIGFGGQFIPPGVGAARDQYLQALKKSVDPELFSKLYDLLPPKQEVVDGKKWSIAYTIISARGAIERHTLSGQTNPLIIKKSVIELMSPVGTVPKVVFELKFSE